MQYKKGVMPKIIGINKYINAKIYLNGSKPQGIQAELKLRSQFVQRFLAFGANVPQKRLLLSMVALLCERTCEYERNLSSACK